MYIQVITTPFVYIYNHHPRTRNGTNLNHILSLSQANHSHAIQAKKHVLGEEHHVQGISFIRGVAPDVLAPVYSESDSPKPS